MLQGKTALITGSTSGIGLGVALKLARQGARVVLNGFGEIDAAKAAVASTGASVGFHGADLTKVSDIEDLMAYCERDFGGVDVLVNNAGIQHVSPIETFPVERWNTIIALNLSAVFHTTRLALPLMRQRNWGRIINIASVHGLVASVNKSAYVTAKHGVVGLTKTTALETATTGITANAICPGWVLTPLVQKQVDARAAQECITPQEAQARMLAEKQPSLQMSTPEQIGDMAVFLCSAAANNMRGNAWQVDGGWTAQ